MYDTGNPPPIPFDKVMEGRSISSNNSPLFKLPVQILNIIGNQLSLSSRDLASLALVNTDCRQLARSWQFRIVMLHDKTSSENLLRLLHREAVERIQNQGFTNSLSLGACVRRFITTYEFESKVASALENFNSRNLTRNNLDDSFDNYDVNWFARSQIIMNECGWRNDNYLPDIYFVISSLIHLESIEIFRPDLNQKILDSVITLPVKYISLSYTLVYDFNPNMNISEWPLESLEIIYLGWQSFTEKSESSCSNFSSNWEIVLRLCAPFLKSLMLAQPPKMDCHFKQEFICSVIKFPNLIHLNLNGLHINTSALRGFILASPYLSFLAINYDIPNIRTFLDCECRINSLKTLVLFGGLFHEFDNLSFDFLRRNPQLEGFGFNDAISHTVLEYVLRLFRESGNLKKLSMIWEGSQIPESSLEELRSLKLIENVHLGSGVFENVWLINHHLMVERLRSLRCLKRLAFTGDMYYYTVYGDSTKYTDKYENICSLVFDRHYQDMRVIALSYFDAFPKLELLHIGKLTFEVLRIGNGFSPILNKNYDFIWGVDILDIRK